MTLTDWLSEQEKICEAATALDCGDNSCLYAKKKGGMRTNGGCQCFKNLPPEKRHFIQRAFRNSTALPQALQVIRELREALRKIQFNFETDWKCETCKQVNEYCYKPIAVALARADEIVKGSEG